MKKNLILKQYLVSLLEGDRTRCRSVIEEAMQTGLPAISIYSEIIWPMMVEIDDLRRKGKISPIQENLATRINRTIVDQLQNKLPHRPEKFKKVTICCAQDEIHELGGQIMADLFESDGWEVRFLGGGLTNDDILEFTNEYAPDILLIYGTAPKQAPALRQLIDTIRGVNAWPDMKIMLSGGVFNRAEGLWQEIGADLFAPTAFEAVQAAAEDKPVEPEERTINRRKRKRQKVAVATE